jgi:hypothetical protein
MLSWLELMKRIALLLPAALVLASDARFTDELWVPVEPVYQKILALRTHPTPEQESFLASALRQALLTLVPKAPRPEWREFLVRDAAVIPASVKTRVTLSHGTEEYANFLTSMAGKRTFGEGLAVVLIEYWMDFELAKDRHQSMNPEAVETMAQLTRMMNSHAATLDAESRQRLKDSFEQAARLKLGFEEQ